MPVYVPRPKIDLEEKGRILGGKFYDLDGNFFYGVFFPEMIAAASFFRAMQSLSMRSLEKIIEKAGEMPLHVYSYDYSWAIALSTFGVYFFTDAWAYSKTISEYGFREIN